MRFKNTVVLFVKVPRFGTVKTRLARDLGRTRARQVYCGLVNHALSELGGRRPWRLVLAVTPPGRDWRAWPRSLPRIDQGRGDLGARMGRALQRLARPRALVIGSDIPEISAAAVREAFQRLRDADFTFGPCPDGGYWMIGWHRRRAWPRSALRQCRWSSEHALADSRASLPKTRRVALARCLDDLDTIADWHTWKRRKDRQRGQP